MNVSPTIQHLHGRILSITGTDPAAGAHISETVPARRRWLLHGLTFELTTDATEITRQMGLTIDDGTNDLLALFCTTTQIQSLSYVYNFYHFVSLEVKTDVRIYVPIPVLPLYPGYRLRTFATSFQAADNLSAPQMLVEEWIDP